MGVPKLPIFSGVVALNCVSLSKVTDDFFSSIFFFKSTVDKKRFEPGDSSPDLLIPDRWRSPVPFEGVT